LKNPKQEKLSLVMDQINQKFGPDAAYLGGEPDDRDKAPTRISFTRIPDQREFWISYTVADRYDRERYWPMPAGRIDINPNHRCAACI